MSKMNKYIQKTAQNTKERRHKHHQDKEKHQRDKEKQLFKHQKTPPTTLFIVDNIKNSTKFKYNLFF